MAVLVAGIVALVGVSVGVLTLSNDDAAPPGGSRAAPGVPGLILPGTPPPVLAPTLTVPAQSPAPPVVPAAPVVVPAPTNAPAPEQLPAVAPPAPVAPPPASPPPAVTVPPVPVPLPVTTSPLLPPVVGLPGVLGP